LLLCASPARPAAATAASRDRAAPGPKGRHVSSKVDAAKVLAVVVAPSSAASAASAGVEDAGDDEDDVASSGDALGSTAPSQDQAGTTGQDKEVGGWSAVEGTEYSSRAPLPGLSERSVPTSMMRHESRAHL